MPHAVEGPRPRRPVPLRPEDLVALIGPSTAWQLCQLAGGQRIPSLSRYLRWTRARLIWADWRRGYDLWTLAQKYRLSVRTVRRVIAAHHAGNLSARATE
jgi:hypothetical protein